MVGVSSRRRTVERPCDHGFVVDDGELVVYLVFAREVGTADAFFGSFEGLSQGYFRLLPIGLNDSR